MGIKMDKMRRITLSVALLCWVSIGNLSATVQNVSSFPAESMIHRLERLNEIGKTTGQSVSYNATEIRNEEAPAFIAETDNMEEWLYKSLSQSEFTYEKRNSNHYLVVRNKQAEPEQIQQVSVLSGRVTDVQNEPLIGVNIVEKGTSNGTVTDIDGQYSLSVPANAVIVFSYIGYTAQEIPRNGQNTINVVLGEDSELLDEVVVVGYGTMERRAVTSSISSVRGEDLVSGLTGSTIGTVLRGKVSGLSISGNDSPNSSSTMQLRGIASINASQTPLIVIDGVPGGDFRALNQEDIASIDVLKDASAGAIYGTRATGGVILITTKQAQEGPMKISYTGELMVETTRKQLEVLSAEEFVEADLGTDYGHNTDWFDLITRTPVTNRHVLTMSGGSPNSRIYTSFSYQDMQGLALEDSRRDYNGRINTDFRFFDNLLEVRTHTNYRHLDRNEAGAPSTGSSPRSIFEQALLLNPTETAFDTEDITGYNIMAGQGLQYNPLADVKLRSNKSMNKYLTTDGVARINFLPELYLQGTIGYQAVTTQTLQYTSANHRESVDNSVAGNGYHGFSKNEKILAEAYFNYNKTLGQFHYLNAVLGHSFEEINQESFSLRNKDFPIEHTAIWNIGSGLFLKEGTAEMSSNKSPRDRLASFFGRVNYSYDDKYMATGSLRREGSSKFGPNHRWGTFWSLSGGWRISRENFMSDLEFINDLKVRAGYGVVGNNGFTAGLSVPMYSTDNAWWNYDGVIVQSYGASRNVNPDLKWEEKKEWNVGVDYSLFNNRIYGKFDYYIRKVEGMIYNIAVPQPPNVYATTLMNGGDLENQGWEFEIGADIVKTKDWDYLSTMRLSHNETTIKHLGGSATFQDRMSFPAPGAPGTAVRLQPGSIIGQFFLFKHAGFDDDGGYLIYDKDNNVIPAADRSIEDKRYIGNAIPKIIIAWDHTLRYKNIDMTMYLRSHLGHDVYNMTEMYYGIPNIAGQNVLKETYEKNKHITGDKQLTDYFLQDGSFLKIDAINIGYNFDLNKYHRFLGKARLYGTIRDVLCITGYKGLDPEVNTMGLDPGFDDHRVYYPKMRRFTIGLQLNF